MPRPERKLPREATEFVKIWAEKSHRFHEIFADLLGSITFLKSSFVLVEIWAKKSQRFHVKKVSRELGVF